MGHKNAWKFTVLAADLRPLGGSDDFEADTAENILVWRKEGQSVKIQCQMLSLHRCYMTLGDVTW